MGDYTTQGPFDPAIATRFAQAKEAVWLRIGVLQSTMNDRERALEAFERVLQTNPSNVKAMTQAGAVLAKKECYPQAVQYLQRAIQADESCGEAWAVLAHCYVMTDDLQKAYQAYDSALRHLPNPRDPNLWYGIGLLYDRYGSLDHALEAFLLVLSISPEFERADEVCFCIGIIYKEQQKFDDALKYFNKVVVAANPPPPLTRADGWYQIGHVSELKRDIPAALEMYKQALAENPKHPKTLQNYGWLEHQHNNNSSEAIRLLKASADLDSTDGQTWYLLGRVYMALREFRQAYDAYQQAVYRDDRNATFWCSIGVLYYQMNQYRDAMDAYSRAIRLNPYVSEVWYDLGTLYESCGQNEDAVDAYRRAAEIAPENTQITARLAVLENSMNPSSMHHQQQQPPDAQKSAAQASQAGAHSAPQSLPQQMHPEMRSAGPSHIYSHPGGPAGNKGGSLDRPHMFPHSKQEGLLPAAPSDMPGEQGMAGQPPLTQRHHPTVPHPGIRPVGGGASEGIPGMQVSTANGLAANRGSFQMPDGRSTLPPASLPAIPTPSSHGGSNGNHMNPGNSQPQASQTPSSMLPALPLCPVRDSLPPKRPTAPAPHTQSPGHGPMLPESSMRPHSQHPHQDSQTRNAQSQGGQHSPKAQVAGLSAQMAPIHGEPEDQHAASTQNQASTPYEPISRNQNQAQQGQPSSPSPRPQPHQSMQTQSVNPMPQLQTHSQVPNMQQPQPSTGESKSERIRAGPTPVDGGDRKPPMETVNSTSRFSQGERPEFKGTEQHVENRLPKIDRPERNEVASSAQDGESSFGGPGNRNMTSTRDRIPSSIREPAEGGSRGASPSRQVGIHDVSGQDNRDDTRRHSSSRHDGSQREGHESPDKMNRDSAQQNGRGENGKGDRVFPSAVGMTSARNGREEADMQSGMQQSVPIHSLPLPSTAPLPSMPSNDGGKRSGSPSHGGAAPAGGSSGMGSGGGSSSLPPLNIRNSSPLSRIGRDGSKEMSSSVGMPGGVGLGSGSSSLNQFGKGTGRSTTAPVSNSLVPSPLPSPLTNRLKPGSGMVHSRPSPRLPTSSGPSTFKPISVPGPSSNYEQMENVPSPGSLPVLPALSAGTNYEEDKSGKEKHASGEEEGGEGTERRGEARSKFEGKAEKDGGEGGVSSGQHARVTEDNLDNKPVFGVLRPGPSSGEKDMSRSESEEKAKSPSTSTGRGSGEGGVLSAKRDNVSKDDVGRTPKRPRLHDVNDKDLSGKSYGYDGIEEGEKSKDNAPPKEGDVSKGGLGGSIGKSDVVGFKEGKSDRRSSGSVSQEEGKKHRRDSGGRDSGEMSKGGGLGGQMIDMPRLSNQPIPKMSAPPISGPLPSFRTERGKNLTRGSGSSSGMGKSLNGESTSRGALQFALRSAPVSYSSSPKNLGGPSGRGGGDQREYDGSPRMGEGGSSKRGEDKGEMGRGGGRSERD